MDRVNFKLGNVISNAVDSNMKCYEKKQSVAEFYAKHKEDTSKVGRTTTYNVTGERNYKLISDDQRYKF
ncbi:unknown [Helicoverpa armigera nucleopolyhedrovirus]|uniref:Ac55 n=5 Tax=Alphabaculovirus helarmigerae TaxID=3047947 RepID=Q77M03_9ABAC|nr:hypothetical protein HanGV4gp048 [Helicoverpa armigera nucleopolyhedrovirus G4]NP_203603.1 hypothetical protein [Helicoverpa armigera nucleopolyhedrovirus]AAL56194.1 ORF49 [Helicoverpa zea single nucleopolyhedrovirus]AEN03972.1 hypothetical protein [Helicoverpa armigera NPV strain Australia]AIG63090.1 ORF48 [Helicoverpa SNPV AC53]AIG63227.1 ORF48 [Helicoverpa armigera SNPV]AXR98037.1 hypothetical protein [Helicoverpa assulta nucleopolyhedrovirus]BAG74613.1 hypothetical protein [Helicoverp